MAGNYPDAPSWRMAYDRDGSIGYTVEWGTNEVAELVSGDLSNLNSEHAPSGFTLTRVGLSGQTNILGVIFPELRDVDAVYVYASASAGNALVEVSTDTTNGADGTWVTLAPLSFSAPLPPINPGYRSPQSGTALGVRSVRVRNLNDSQSLTGLAALHIYGERSPGQSVNALELWHPSSDEKLPAAWLDWGNTPRGSSEDRTFRVKNISTVSTAQAVRVAMDVLTDGSPSVPGQHLLSYGGGSFLAQVNVGVLAPGAISGPVTLRRVMASNAQLGLFAFRVFAEPDAWS